MQQRSAALHAAGAAYPGNIFVDTTFRPYPDQWAFLALMIPMNAHDIDPTILRATGNTHPLDVTFIHEEDLATPWKPEQSSVYAHVNPYGIFELDMETRLPIEVVA